VGWRWDGDVRCGKERCGKPNLYLCQYSPVKSCRRRRCRPGRSSSSKLKSAMRAAHDKERREQDSERRVQPVGQQWERMSLAAECVGTNAEKCFWFVVRLSRVEACAAAKRVTRPRTDTPWPGQDIVLIFNLKSALLMRCHEQASLGRQRQRKGLNGERMGALQAEANLSVSGERGAL
jgi:hypothetical protein